MFIPGLVGSSLRRLLVQVSDLNQQGGNGKKFPQFNQKGNGVFSSARERESLRLSEDG